MGDGSTHHAGNSRGDGLEREEAVACRAVGEQVFKAVCRSGVGRLALRAVTTYTSGSPTFTGLGVTVLATVKSTSGVTLLEMVTELLFRFGSPTSGELTLAVLPRLRMVEPVLSGRTVMSTVADPPEASAPRLHETVADPTLAGADGVQLPWLGEMDAKPGAPALLNRLLRASVTVTLVAASGPALFTVRR